MGKTSEIPFSKGTEKVKTSEERKVRVPGKGGRDSVVVGDERKRTKERQEF